MKNATEAVGMFDKDCYFEERGVLTRQDMEEFIQCDKERSKQIDEIVNAISIIGDDGSIWGGFVDELLDFAKGLTCATSSVKELSSSANLAAKSAKAFVAAWRDGKWVPTGGRSSRRKMGVGGKRW